MLGSAQEMARVGRVRPVTKLAAPLANAAIMSTCLTARRAVFPSNARPRDVVRLQAFCTQAPSEALADLPIMNKTTELIFGVEDNGEPLASLACGFGLEVAQVRPCGREGTASR